MNANTPGPHPLAYAAPTSAPRWPLNARFAVAGFGLIATVAGFATLGFRVIFAAGGLLGGMSEPGHPPPPFDWQSLAYGALLYVPLLAGGMGGLIWAARAEAAATLAERHDEVSAV